MNGKKVMDRYENLGTVGEGSYGVVTKCKDKSNGLIVAIKKFLESDTDKAVKKIATREIRILKSLRHENLVNLIEVFRRNKRIYLVFEFIEHNLLEEIEKTSSGLGETRTKEVMYQVCRGLDFMHSNNVIHRDLKPENILINKNGLIKLCDFGFARHIASSNEIYTDYVATRWYRSPELLVGDPRYGKPVDVWSLGTLAYEVLTSKPLFPGESDLDQLYLIINSLGDLPDSMKLYFQQNHFYMNAKFPRIKNFNPLQNKLKKYSNNLVKFIIDALIIDPHKRSTTSELLRHELFSSNNWLDDFSSKLKNIVAIYESNISKSLAAKNKLAKKSTNSNTTSSQNINSNSKLSNHKQFDKQSEINRINEMNKQIEIAKLKEISKFIIQNETVSTTSHNETTDYGRSSFNNMGSLNLNTNTRLPKIESSTENVSYGTGLKVHQNGNISCQATSPTNVNINTTNNNNNNNNNNTSTTINNSNSSSRHFGNLEKLKHHSTSVEFPVETNQRSNTILSIQNNSSHDLHSNSLTNTNKLNSNSSNFFNSNNVFILEETYKLNNGNGVVPGGFGLKNGLKRSNEHKSTSKIESGLNLPQVKQIELYSKSTKNNVYDKNPFLMPINKK